MVDLACRTMKESTVIETEKQLHLYTFQTFYHPDRSLFSASVWEVPELEAFGATRSEAVLELEKRLLEFAREQAEDKKDMPTPLSPSGPQTISLEVSKKMFEKLHHLSRMEGMGVEKLALEMILEETCRRFNARKAGGHSPGSRPASPKDSRSSQKKSHAFSKPANFGNRKQEPNGNSNARRHSNKFRAEELQSSENFLEYVRNLEKGRQWRNRK